MKLDLKSLRARKGVSVPFSGHFALKGSDFFEPVHIRSPLYAEGVATMHAENVVFVDVKLELELDRVCSRCLTPIPARIALEEELALRGTDEPETLPDDFSYAVGESEIELDPIFLSLLLSQFDLKPLCKPDCKGICSSCGKDLNRFACSCSHAGQKDPRWKHLSELLKE
ncbi:MAG TPA: DUF177 domain-containing protein [Candidatus Bipolaricaulota bacterium]